MRVKFTTGMFGGIERWIDTGYGWQYQETFNLVEK